VIPPARDINVSMSAIDSLEFERRLKTIEPSLLLVSGRILRRVIKQHTSLPGLGLQVPHRKSYVIGRDALLAIADAEELGIGNGAELPDNVLLLVRPDAARLAARPAGKILRDYWRLIFHARVHMCLDHRRIQGTLTEQEILERIEQIGRAAWEEIRAVLTQERFLLPPHTPETIYVEFAALYLELRHFAPEQAAVYFPGLGSNGAIDQVLAHDVDAGRLLQATRPAGSDDALPRNNSAVSRPRTPEEMGLSLNHKTPRALASMRERAESARALGNLVRSAVLGIQGSAGSTSPEAVAMAQQARADVAALVKRLQQALDLPGADSVPLEKCLAELLQRAARGFWTVEARLLYDLQKVCLEHERELYAVDAVAWIVSLGKLAVKRPLPAHRAVLQVKHLHSAVRRLGRTRLADADRHALAHILHGALHRQEQGLRRHFGPLLARALDEVKLRPRNLPERLARHKLIEELLDRIVEHGYLTMSDLRDALSSNQLKLPDLEGPGDLLGGGPLIRLNRRLALLLDGVYHRGEIYRRWLQRLSSMAFGTALGRALTRFLALPFGGAFVVLEFVGHFYHVFAGQPPVQTPAVFPDDEMEPDWSELDLDIGPEFVQPHGPGFTNFWSLSLLGLFFFGLLHVPPFRRGVGQGLRLLGRGIRYVFWDGPRWLLQTPLMRRVMESAPVRFVARVAVKPLIAAGVTTAGSALSGLDHVTTALLGGLVFLLAGLFCNSRLGRDLEEAAVDWLVRNWQKISTDLVPNIVRFIVDAFRRALDGVERFLYTVDEWFRFQTGENRFTFVFKLIGGTIWFLLTYIVRFAINLLIEPQINPIKHFPVVTVSHKLLIPLIPALAGVLAETMDHKAAIGLATAIITSIPGIFGFLVWELKENWRLYEANRPASLRPVMVGAHGETVVRLLRRGFHSGTVPRLFAKLRRSVRRGRHRAEHRQREALHHVEAGIRHFIDRDFLAYLRHCPAWAHKSISLAHVYLATNRIALEFSCPGLGAESLLFHFEESAGRLEARIARHGWLASLSRDDEAVWNAALAGLYRWAGVDLAYPGDPRAEPIDIHETPMAWTDWLGLWHKLDKDERGRAPLASSGSLAD
jgi:hypothetical protein